MINLLPMVVRLSLPFLASLIALMAAILCAPLSAQSASTNTIQERICALEIPQTLEFSDIPAARIADKCDGTIPGVGLGRIAMVLDPGSGESNFFESRSGYLKSLTLIAVRGEEAIAASTYPDHALFAGTADFRFSVPLPVTTQRPDHYIVVFENADFPPTITDGRIVAETVGNRPGADWKRITVAIMVGFLLLPIILNLGLYRVLHAEFLLWHALLALAMAAHLMSSGLLTSFMPLTVKAMADLAVITFSVVSISAVCFATRFVEWKHQSAKLRRALEWALVLVLVLTVLRVMRIEETAPYLTKLYFAAFLPVAGLSVWFAADAARRGSRAVWFLIFAWLPFLLLAVLRLGSMLGSDTVYIDAIWLFYLGATVEVTITSLGVVDRVMAIKRQRDLAQSQVNSLAKISEHDSLTGLLNRRLLDTRFANLRKDGFSTFALIDLDRFKDINDRFGHQTGDKTLIACAQALRTTKDRDTIAIRFGGEEFVLLMRGKNTVQRAEALRQAIPIHIASNVDGLDRPVTASMGAVALPRSSEDFMSFEELYARADKLLYEAKAAGRNRMVFERLKVFASAPSARPIAKRPDEIAA